MDLPAAIAREDITGLVLAGGRGSRMGGVDKGLQLHRGRPLALHALERLAPQVGRTLLNANRHLETYAAFGAPVCPDALPDYPGPLAGFLAGLEHCVTPWLVTVPCDTPDFPADLVERLARAAVQAQADLAIAATVEAGVHQRHPVFCLMRASLRDDLAAAVRAGERKIDRWTARQRGVELVFDDAGAFFNANTPDELRSLQER
jgi:molybdenum cofactor guanylyltransferase